MKHNELCLAVWPGANNRKYWESQSSIRSTWLHLRVVETEGENIDLANDNQVSNVGIWIWAHAGYGCSIELKAHNIYSATPDELISLAKWIKKVHVKIAKAYIPATFGVKETLILTLGAMGVRRSVRIDPDWRSPTRYTLLSLEDGIATENYAIALDEMELVRIGETK